MNNLKEYGKAATRKGFGEGLVELGKKNSQVVAIGADVSGSVMTSMFEKEFPERFISVGVAEQNATTVAAGLALSGKVPFFSSYSAFAAFRNADQLRISVCYNEANVKIGGGHSGLTVGPDGATHQSMEEVSFLRALPNLNLVVPCDYMETKRATIMAGEMKGPFYIRFGRPNVPMFTTEETPFEYGKAFNFREGSDLAIFANGHMVWAALEAADMLQEKKGIEARVVNCCWVKPMDHDAVVSAAKDCGAIVTAEEHQVHGGLGAAVAESVVKNYPVPMEFVGMADEFGRSGEPFELMEHYELNANTIYASSLKVLERKEKGYIGTRKISDISRISDYQ